MNQDGGKSTDLAMPETKYPNAMMPSQDADFRPLPAIPQTVEGVMLARLLDAGSLELTEHQKEILFAPVPHEVVEIRPDGKIYVQSVEFRQKLVDAFELDWQIIPDGKPAIDESQGIILWGFWLCIHGVPRAYAVGEQKWKKGDWQMSKGDALSAVQANATMRLCKQIHICADLWRASYGRNWKKLHATSKWERGRDGKDRQVWSRQDESFGGSEDSGRMGEEQDRETGQETESNDESRNTDDNGAGHEEAKGKDAWRRKAFQHAADLGMSEDELRKICQEHFFQVDLETGQYLLGKNGSKIPVTEKKQLHGKQWRKLANHLYKLWVAAGRPKAEKDKDKPKEEAAEEQVEEASEEASEESPEKEAEEASKDKGEAIKFPVDGSLENMIDATSIMMGVSVDEVEIWLRVNYITDIESPYASTETAIKEFLTKLATEPAIAEKAKQDVPKAVKWYNAVAIPEAVDEMLTALSGVPHDLQAKFLANMGVRTVRGIRQGKFRRWKRVLQDSKEHLDIEKALDSKNEGEEASEEDAKDGGTQEGLRGEEEEDPDIPF